MSVEPICNKAYSIVSRFTLSFLFYFIHHNPQQHLSTTPFCSLCLQNKAYLLIEKAILFVPPKFIKRLNMMRSVASCTLLAAAAASANIDLNAHDSPEHGVDVLSRLLQMKSQTRKLDEREHQCGVVFLYHIPGTDGSALNEWLKKLKDDNDAEYISSVENQPFKEGVEKMIQDVKGWKIVHAQDDSLSLHSDQGVLQKWRDIVTNQQCAFVTTTAFADTIDHSVSHTYKKLSKCDCTPEEFKERGYDMAGTWIGQLDYFLFNNGEVPEMEMKDKVRRGVDILKRQFDLVVLNNPVDNRHKVTNAVLTVTGWSSPGPLTAQIEGDLIFTKELVSKFTKMATKNGDGDFIDAVGHVWNDDLAYLLKDLMTQ